MRARGASGKMSREACSRGEGGSGTYTFELALNASGGSITPDGAYVAFCIIWFDHLNRTGLFEPVGTHKDYQRRGFGRALLLHGLQQMADAGMEIASVAHFGDNAAARGLYQSCGFRPWHLQDGFVKPV